MAWQAIAAGAGLALQAYGQYRAGKDAAKTYDYNRQFAKYQEKYIDERAKVELAQLERNVRKVIARQRAIQGASGTVPDQGSNLDAIIQTEDEAAIDAQIIRREAEIQKDLARKQARLYDKFGMASQQAGILQAGATLLGGLSRWDWRTSQLATSTSTPTYSSPPVAAFSGYTPSR